MPRAPPRPDATACRRSFMRRRRHDSKVSHQTEEPWFQVVQTWGPGSFPLPTCSHQIGVPRGLSPQRRHSVSTPSLTPVATGTTVVTQNTSVIRFNHVVDAQLAVADL